MTVNFDEYEVLVTACRPSEAEMVKLLQEAIPGGELPPVYPGSVEGTCAGCHHGIWIGPRTQEKIEEIGRERIKTMCFTCAVTYAYNHAPNNTRVIDLGNNYVPKPE